MIQIDPETGEEYDDGMDENGQPYDEGMEDGGGLLPEMFPTKPYYPGAIPEGEGDLVAQYYNMGGDPEQLMYMTGGGFTPDMMYTMNTMGPRGPIAPNFRGNTGHSNPLPMPYQQPKGWKHQLRQDWRAQPQPRQTPWKQYMQANRPPMPQIMPAQPAAQPMQGRPTPRPMGPSFSNPHPLTRGLGRRNG